jgi:hypothetical protein
MTPDEAVDYKQLKEDMQTRIERMRIYMRNRRKILKTLPLEQRRAYRIACRKAWEAGEQCPPFPGGKVSSVEEL